MQFFHKSLSGTDYLNQLRDDLKRCSQLQFLIAYISGAGIEAIGEDLLSEALNKSDSFGITSLACGFDYNDIIALQEQIGKDTKLKLFLNIAKKVKGEEPLTLLHSKIIYLKVRDRGELKEVLYLGSHNWTGRALGISNGKNAEASIRFEDSAISNNSLMVEARQHLKEAWNLESCLAATKTNLEIFESWNSLYCGSSSKNENKAIKEERLERVLVITAICTGNYFIGKKILNLKGKPLYFQVYGADEGKFIKTIDERIIILVWNSKEEFKQNARPLLMSTRVSTINQTDNGTGSNTSNNAVAGFEWALHDSSINKEEPEGIHIAGLGDCMFWSLQHMDRLTTSSEFDKGQKPPFQFTIEVEEIIPPEELQDLGLSTISSVYWRQGEVALSSKPSITAEKQKGIAIKNTNRRKAIIAEYQEIFGITDTAVKLTEEHNRQSLGFKLADSPINRFLIDDTKFIAPLFYEQNRRKGISVVAKVEQQEAQKPGSWERIKRIDYYYLEAASKLISRLKRWRESDR